MCVSITYIIYPINLFRRWFKWKPLNWSLFIYGWPLKPFLCEKGVNSRLRDVLLVRMYHLPGAQYIRMITHYLLELIFRGYLFVSIALQNENVVCLVLESRSLLILCKGIRWNIYGRIRLIIEIKTINEGDANIILLVHRFTPLQ